MVSGGRPAAAPQEQRHDEQVKGGAAQRDERRQRGVRQDVREPRVVQRGALVGELGRHRLGVQKPVAVELGDAVSDMRLVGKLLWDAVVASWLTTVSLTT